MKARLLQWSAFSLILLAWATFLLGLILAILGRPLGFLTIGDSSWNYSFLIHLSGVVIAPLLVVISCLLAKRVLWLRCVLFAAYAVATIGIYPTAVRHFLQHYPQPKDPGWDWTEHHGIFYYVDTTMPPGDSGFSGLVTLFPPTFDLPKSHPR